MKSEFKSLIEERFNTCVNAYIDGDTSKDNLEINLGHNEKIRLRCIFNGNTEEVNLGKSYLTFSSND